jgi:hypothetical protein
MICPTCGKFMALTSTGHNEYTCRACDRIAADLFAERVKEAQLKDAQRDGRVKPCLRGNDWCPVDCCLPRRESRNEYPLHVPMHDAATLERAAQLCGGLTLS